MLPDSETDSENDSEGSADYTATGSYSVTGSYTASYTAADEFSEDHASPDYDASLDLACGFNFQNTFWIAGGWGNSRQVLFQIKHYVMKI